MIYIALITLFAVIMLQMGYIGFKVNSEIAYCAPVYSTKEWLKVGIPLLFHNTFQNLLKQTDIVMLGLLVGAGGVGIYSAASKTSIWASFVLQTINIVTAPVYATLYTKGDREQLQKVVSTVSWWIFIPSIVMALGLILFSKPLLSIFGPEFVDAEWNLRILVIGQLFSALCGSVGNLITMTGYQNEALIVSSVCAVINLFMNAILIHFWGTIGAALSTTFVVVLRNTLMSVLVIKKIEINPTIFVFLYQ